MIVKVPAPSIQWSPTSPGTRKISHVITINPCGTLHFCTKLLTVEIWPIQPLRTLNICSKFHGNPSSSRQHTPLKFTPDEKSETEVSLKQKSVWNGSQSLKLVGFIPWEPRMSAAEIFTLASLCVFLVTVKRKCVNLMCWFPLSFLLFLE